MDVIQSSEDVKPIRHGFDKRAFRRYSVRLLLWPSIALVAEMLFTMSSRDSEQDLFMLVIRLGLQIFIFSAAAISFFTMLYTLKSSDVFTASGCVLYRKRKLFISQIEGICFVVYHITNVRSVSDSEKYPATVKGDIDAASVLKDGKTILIVRKIRKVAIPPCFTDMSIIRETLQSMETGTVKVEDSIISDAKQSGLPI